MVKYIYIYIYTSRVFSNKQISNNKTWLTNSNVFWYKYNKSKYIDLLHKQGCNKKSLMQIAFSPSKIDVQISILGYPTISVHFPEIDIFYE